MAEREQNPLAELVVTQYDKLRRIARAIVGGATSGTLQATALVNELYVNARKSKYDGSAKSERDLCSICVKIIRDTIVNHSRAKQAMKRGGGVVRVPLTETYEIEVPERLYDEYLPKLAEALDQLEELDSRVAAVVRMRFLIQLAIPEVAAILECSEATVQRDWERGKGILRQKLGSLE